MLYLTITEPPPISHMGTLLSLIPRRRKVKSSTMSRNTQNANSNNHHSAMDMEPRQVKRVRTNESLEDAEKTAAARLIDAHDLDIATRRGGDAAGMVPPSGSGSGERSGLPFHTGNIEDYTPDVKEYKATRELILQQESALSFDATCRARATRLEKRVDSIMRKARRRDISDVYGQEAARIGYQGQLHPRFPGDHFLSNVELINQTILFDMASKMPKGAHLHIHFNACLPPEVLLDIAKGMDRMFITSNLPLVPDNDYENYDKCEIQFSRSPKNEAPGNLFKADYQPRQIMEFQSFLDQFPLQFPKPNRLADVDLWLRNKLLFEEVETHNLLQTAAGAWEKFNGRTRMMKGLFNYETAYRKYTRLCLEDFVRDNILYAEIRPNFMTSNQLYRDDGIGIIDNWGIMELIIEEVENFQKRMREKEQFFGGLKVIYCTPRSMATEDVRAALHECLEFKKKWPKWIAGFDLVGEEAKGKPLSAFVPELLQFKKDCAVAGVDIPLLLHCGETQDFGTEIDGNLVDALLLGSKRIGHGFALSKHPYIMQHMKAQGVCLELCPISNEILGLTPRVSGHSMYQLLANNVHCTVNSDNGALFRSTLSHDFYQVMVGKADLGLYGWKQLVLWSLEHSCLGDVELAEVKQQWELQWEKFLQWVVEKYGYLESELDDKDDVIGTKL